MSKNVRNGLDGDEDSVEKYFPSLIFRQTIGLVAAGLAISYSIALACALLAQTGAGAADAMSLQEVRWLTARLNLYPPEGVIDPAAAKLRGLGYREYRMTASAAVFAAGRNIGLGPWEVSEIESGWPLRCLRRTVIQRVDFDVVFAGPSVVSLNAKTPTLPFVPVWGNLVVNALLYALLLWLVIFAPAIVRGVIRRHRGLCPACGYPVGQSPLCTECGRPVIAK